MLILAMLFAVVVPLFPQHFLNFCLLFLQSRAFLCFVIVIVAFYLFIVNVIISVAFSMLLLVNSHKQINFFLSHFHLFIIIIFMPVCLGFL